LRPTTGKNGLFRQIEIEALNKIAESKEDFGQGLFGTTSPRTDGTTGHIHILLSDDDYLDHTGAFKVDNDNWKMKIWGPDPLESAPYTFPDDYVVVQDWVGEDISATGWTGSAINSNEGGALMTNPVTTDITAGSYYKDTSKTSYNDDPNYDVSH
jgi:hypothetical protein